MKAVADRLPPDFTEARFGVLLDRAASRFRFGGIAEAGADDSVSIWRHDIDFSPHRALALARMEAERSMKGVYFVLTGSPFYSVLESGVRQILREIATLGHEIGLHYDAAAISGPRARHDERIAFEAALIRHELGTSVTSFSLHNPSVSENVPLDEPMIAGLHNASATDLRSTFAYCSDSNGLWRFRPLIDVLADPATVRLYALTHAEWWTREPMTSEEKVERCIEGRARRVEDEYWALIRKHRPEVIRRG